MLRHMTIGSDYKDMIEAIEAHEKISSSIASAKDSSEILRLIKVVKANYDENKIKNLKKEDIRPILDILTNIHREREIALIDFVKKFMVREIGESFSAMSDQTDHYEYNMFDMVLAINKINQDGDFRHRNSNIPASIKLFFMSGDERIETITDRLVKGINEIIMGVPWDVKVTIGEYNYFISDDRIKRENKIYSTNENIGYIGFIDTTTAFTGEMLNTILNEIDKVTLASEVVAVLNKVIMIGLIVRTITAYNNSLKGDIQQCR